VKALQVTITVPGKRESETLELQEPATIFNVLEKLNFYPDEVIVISNVNEDKVVPVDSKVVPGDNLKIIPVASGG
jgi:sulfur carrier protein ThiS